MYYYNRKSPDSRDARVTRPVTLRPSRRYYYSANNDSSIDAAGRTIGHFGLGQCDSGAADAMTHELIINTIKCELLRPFTDPNDPRLHKRRLRLRELFNAVPRSKVMELYSRLVLGTDPLAKLFHRKLHRVTRAEMIAILARLFFRDYEFRFNILNDRFSVDNNPDPSLNKTQRKEDVSGLVGDLNTAPGILWKRLIVRIDAALDGIVPAASNMPTVSQSDSDRIKRISDAQIQLFREWFPDSTGGIDFKTFQRVFEQFANGELRDPTITDHPHFAEPGGGAFFLFAEFGFLSAEQSIDAPIWKETLKTFVKIQEVFIHVYRENPKSFPPAVNAPLPSGSEKRDILVVNGGGFDSRNFKRTGSSLVVGKGQSNESRKIALRSKYDSMSLSQLINAARDNIIRAVRMP